MKKAADAKEISADETGMDWSTTTDDNDKVTSSDMKRGNRFIIHSSTEIIREFIRRSPREKLFRNALDKPSYLEKR